MLKSLSYTLGSEKVSVADNLENIYRTEQPQKIHWLHMYGNDSQNTEILKSHYSFNELAIADSTRERHPPKFESFHEYILLILRPVQLAADLSCEFHQVAIFLGNNYLVSKTFEPVPAVELVWNRYKQGDFNASRAVRNIVYKIFRETADEYIEVIYKIETRLEEIEEIFETNENDTYLSELTGYNSSLRKIVRNLEYLEKVALQLIEHESGHLAEQISHEYKDVYEQIERALSLAKMYQGLCNDLINAHISITSHKVNQVVKILTIVTVLFLPLSFIVGLYGMNFEFIPELKLRYGYFYVLGFMAVLEIFLFFILRRLKWV